jgi:hypothetical protein
VKLRTWGALLIAGGLAFGAVLRARSEKPVAGEALHPDQSAVERGRRLYGEGRRHDGRPLEALVQGDVPLSGADAACVRCHQRSGFGASEGPVRVPPVVASALLAPPGSPGLAQPASSAPPPGSEASVEARLAAALFEGVGRGGESLARSMPRYRLEPAELRDLAAHLASLDAAVSPGVTSTELRLASVVSDAVPPPEREAFIATLQAYVAAKNGGSRLEEKRSAHAPWPERNEYTAYRRWSLEIWVLEGAADTWSDQLRERYENQPVFALVSGLIGGSFEPIASLCDELTLPCLFPITPLPGDDEPGFYTFHLSRGVHLDADIIASELLELSPPVADVLQLYEATPVGAAAAKALRAALERRASRSGARPPALRESSWRAGASRLADVLGRVDRPTAVVAWLGAAALADVFAEPPEDTTLTTWFASTRLADAPLPWWVAACGSRRCSIVEPSNAAAEASDLRRFGAWARSRGLGVTHPRIQLQAYFALLQLGDALMHVRKHLVREYVLETIEHTAYRSLVTAGLPRLSLASGQRFASKGAYLTRLAPGRGAEPPSWRVP